MKVWSNEDRECMEKFNYFKKVSARLDQHFLVLAACKAPLEKLSQLLVHTDSDVRRAARARIKKLTGGAVE